MADNLTVLQLNVRGIRSQLRLLDTLLKDKGAHVACFNETKMKQPPTLKDFILAASIDDIGHGSAVYIRGGLSFKLININVVKSDSKTNEMLHIRLTDSNTDIILIYCSPYLVIEPNHLQCSNRRTLILGDFNIKCPYINPKSYSLNATGRSIEERLDDGLVLLNDDSATHKSGSILDLHLSTIDLASDFASFHTANGTLSDHLMTISQFNINAPKPNYLRPDWRQFKRKVTNFTNSTDEVDEKAIELATHIKCCYDDCLRPQRRSSNKKIANLIKTKHQIRGDSENSDEMD